MLKMDSMYDIWIYSMSIKNFPPRCVTEQKVQLGINK